MVVYLMLAASAHGETVGFVMMHGKHGTPTQLQQLAEAVSNAGFLAERPEMCWSAARIYDRSYLECFADIDAAAVRLKQHGATAIVILGMSLVVMQRSVLARDVRASRESLHWHPHMRLNSFFDALRLPKASPRHRRQLRPGSSMKK